MISGTGHLGPLYRKERREPAVARGSEGSRWLGRAWGPFTRRAGAILDAPSYSRFPPVTRTGTLGGQTAGWNRLDRVSLHGAMRVCCLARRRRGPRVSLPVAPDLGVLVASPEGFSISVNQAGRRARSFTGPGLSGQEQVERHRSAHGSGPDLRRSPASVMGGG